MEIYKFFKKKSPEVITISINSTNLVLACFEKEKNKKLISLKAYKRYSLENLEIYKLNIFNQIKLNLLLNLFIKENNLQNIVVHLALEGEQIYEKILEVYQLPESINEFNLEVNKKLNWNFFQIHDSRYLFYIAGISHSLIFQYKNFSINSKFNLAKITTINAGVICLIKFISESNIIENINQLKHNSDDIINLLNIEDYLCTNLIINFDEEKYFILKNLGIFL